MGRLMGIEPTNARATIWCVNHFATTAIFKLAGAVGIEPTPEVLETSVLPLNYAPVKWWRGTDSNRRTLRERIYSPPRLATSLPLRHLNCLAMDPYKSFGRFTSVHETKERFLGHKLQHLIGLSGLSPLFFQWCRREDLNPQPTDYKSVALPIELHRQLSNFIDKVARDGIEPPTQGFSVLCSTN
jgi:hypothetical protein